MVRLWLNTVVVLPTDCVLRATLEQPKNKVKIPRLKHRLLTLLLPCLQFFFFERWDLKYFFSSWCMLNAIKIGWNMIDSWALLGVSQTHAGTRWLYFTTQLLLTRLWLQRMSSTYDGSVPIRDTLSWFLYSRKTWYVWYVSSIFMLPIWANSSMLTQYH